MCKTIKLMKADNQKLQWIEIATILFIWIIHCFCYVCILLKHVIKNYCLCTDTIISCYIIKKGNIFRSNETFQPGNIQEVVNGIAVMFF